MILSRHILTQLVSSREVQIPDQHLWKLPEKVLQFGTGVLLRGLPDYLIDQANKQGVFNGRIVMIKSTLHGDTLAYDAQDQLYTQCIRGIHNGAGVDRCIINAAVSRVISAPHRWKEVLACAADPELCLIISNTTEVGIALSTDSILANPPETYPGKLLALLYKRYQVFGGDPTKGFVIIPTELMEDNGKKLCTIIHQLAEINNLEPAFFQWLDQANEFCNSLVDRIVPGKMSPDAERKIQEELGYEDRLMILSEPYALWAIETNREKTRQLLSFSTTSDSVVMVPDIRPYRERKLRLLNGSHTFCCGLALLAGFSTVREAMQNPGFYQFIEGLMREEISRALLPEGIALESTEAFTRQVLDRFSNPYLDHKWLSITLQYSSKMRVRNIPVLLGYIQAYGQLPARMCFGFACYLLFMRSQKRDHSFFSTTTKQPCLISDDLAPVLYQKWEDNELPGLIHAVLEDEKLWGNSLSGISGLENSILSYLEQLMQKGVVEMLKDFQKAG